MKRFMEHIKPWEKYCHFIMGSFIGLMHTAYGQSTGKVEERNVSLGEKIFTGWRQRELLSRIIPHVSEESQKSLSEVLHNSLFKYICKKYFCP